MKYRELIDKLAELAEKAHLEKNSADYAYSSDILRGVSFGAKGIKGTKGSKGF